MLCNRLECFQCFFYGRTCIFFRVERDFLLCRTFVVLLFCKRGILKVLHRKDKLEQKLNRRSTETRKTSKIRYDFERKNYQIYRREKHVTRKKIILKEIIRLHAIGLQIELTKRSDCSNMKCNNLLFIIHITVVYSCTVHSHTSTSFAKPR